MMGPDLLMSIARRLIQDGQACGPREALAVAADELMASSRQRHEHYCAQVERCRALAEQTIERGRAHDAA